MGGAVSAVSSAVSSTVNAAKNVVTSVPQAAIDIAKGKNVGEAIGNAVTKQAAAIGAPVNSLAHSTGFDRIVQKVPGIGGPIGTYMQTSNEINNGGSDVSRSTATQFWRSGIETGAIAYGGYAVGTGAVSGGTALTTVAATKAIASGNVAGAAGLVSGDLAGMGPDLGPLTDAFNSGKDYWSLLDSAKTANLGPYPSSSFDDPSSYGLAKSTTPYDPTLVVLGIGGAAAYFLFRRKFI